MRILYLSVIVAPLVAGMLVPAAQAAPMSVRTAPGDSQANRFLPREHSMPASQGGTCPGNRLVNAGFEGPSRKTEREGTSLSSAVANGWYPWFVRGDARFNREPEFKLEDTSLSLTPFRAHSGRYSQKFFTTWATHTAGFWQQVAVPRGQTVNFSIWVQLYTGQADGFNGTEFLSDPKEPGNYRAYVGIDPFGGTDALSPNVIWSEPFMTYDTWTELGISAVALNDRVTVFTKGQPEWSVKHNDSFWDDACLVVSAAEAQAATVTATSVAATTSAPAGSPTPTRTRSATSTPTRMPPTPSATLTARPTSTATATPTATATLTRPPTTTPRGGPPTTGAATGPPTTTPTPVPAAQATTDPIGVALIALVALALALIALALLRALRPRSE